jgi:cation diffusion facilitator family transporter
MLDRQAASRLEQQTLTLSIYGVVLVAVGSLAYGLFLESDVVILNGIFSLLSLIGGGLNLLAAKLVAKSEDRRFPFGYSHLEPLVLSVNSFLVLLICLYALINGIERIRAGGNAVSPDGVMVFGLLSCTVSLAIWFYERQVARRIHSPLVEADAREWLIDSGFSLVTLLGFAVLPLIAEPARSVWALYADPVLVAVVALLAIPMPLAVLRRSLREVLLISDVDDEVTLRLEEVMDALSTEYDIAHYVHHVIKTGRTRFIELDIVVGPKFTLQTIPEQDRLRERIWKALGLKMDETWLSISLTGEAHWT